MIVTMIRMRKKYRTKLTHKLEAKKCYSMQPHNELANRENHLTPCADRQPIGFPFDWYERKTNGSQTENSTDNNEQHFIWWWSCRAFIKKDFRIEAIKWRFRLSDHFSANASIWMGLSVDSSGPPSICGSVFVCKLLAKRQMRHIFGDTPTNLCCAPVGKRQQFFIAANIGLVVFESRSTKPDNATGFGGGLGVAILIKMTVRWVSHFAGIALNIYTNI